VEENSSVKVDEVDEVDEVDGIIYRHVMWVTLGSGFPVPLLDVAVVLGLQLRMLKKLSDHYDIPFSKHRSRAILVGLLSGCATEGAAKGAFVGTVLGSIPLVNAFTTFLRVYLPFKLGIVVAGASTYAVGRLFAQHFAEGGTLDGGESDKFKRHFREQFKLGIEKVKSWAPTASSAR
jgi:uncharacterized protein (DUF697 family)